MVTMTGLLERTIAELKARQDIHDVLVRYCRGVDLCDVEMMRSCFHDGAIDDHGFFNGPAEEFAERAAENLSTMFGASRHYMTNEFVELSGDFAASETCILCYLRMSRDDEVFDVTVRSRYLDRFERRDGVWKIVHRQLVSDGTRVDKVEEEFPRLNQGALGGRGQDDPSHAFLAHFHQRQPAGEFR